VYWLAHHRIFRYIRAYDRRLLVINLFLLMWVSADTVLGLAAGQVRFAPAHPDPLLLAHILTSLGMALLWWCASKDRKLVDLDIDPVVIRYNNARIPSLSLVFPIAIGISFFSTAAAG
jgi:uncharacterized membrane protein